MCENALVQRVLKIALNGEKRETPPTAGKMDGEMVKKRPS